VETALQDAIAAMITGVTRSMVTVLEVTVGRRLSDSDRRLSTKSVNVKYQITLPKDNSVTVENVQAAVTGAAAKTSLAAAVNKELATQGITVVIAVEETSAKKKAAVVGPGNASHAQSSHMLRAVVSMGMVTGQLLVW